MDEFKKDAFRDPYIDQSSGCLRNLWNINDPEVLSRVGSAFTVMRSNDLEEDSYDLIGLYKLEAAESLCYDGYDDGRRFDFKHLKDIHKHLFQDVYEWAGQTREVDLSKEETHFLTHSLIEQSVEHIFTKLEKEDYYLQGLDANTFSEKAGYYLGEINRIHPFRDGNWRAQLEFINRLAHYSGYHIKWNMAQNMSHKQVVEASIEANKGCLNSMVSLIRENLVDRDVFLEDRRYGSFRIGESIHHAKIGHTYIGTIVGSTERYVMQTLKDLPHTCIILHDRHSLSRTVTHDINKAVEITYPHGSIGLVRDPEKLREKDTSKTHNLEKNFYQHEKHEWER